MTAARLLLTLSTAALLGSGAGSGARFPSTAAPRQQAVVDSTEVEDRLEDRQRDFERLRRRRFPRTRDTGSADCHEIIGRYCFWHEDEAWEPPPEDPEVADARLRLAAALDSGARRLPGSDWVAGQRVRYLVEAARTDEALEAALSCRATPWWCRALLGYARHVAGDYAGAEAAFEASLARMPRERRCEWEDVELLLEGDARGTYEDLPCDERSAFHGRFWRLADPLYLVPGNERRTEHFSRHVLDRMQEDAAGPYGGRWGRDLREILLRYGWPVGWERTRERAVVPGNRSSIVAHHAARGRRFAPPEAALRDPTAVSLESWDPDPERPRSAFAPAYAGGVAPLTHQLAAFRRGDSTRVVAAYAVPADSLTRAREGAPHGAPTALAAFRDADGLPVASRRKRSSGTRGTLVATVPARPSVVSLEVRSRPDSFAARARFGRDLGWRPAGTPDASDLLILRNGARPASLESAAELARGDLVVPPGDSVGLYWELYGLPAEVSFDVAVRLRKPDGGWLRSLARGLGLVGEDEEAVGLEWTDLPDRERAGEPARARPEEGIPGTVSLGLPAELEPGVYVIEVEIRLPGFEPLRRWREIRIDPEARTGGR